MGVDLTVVPALGLIAVMCLLIAWHHGWLRGYRQRKRHEAEMRELSRTPNPQQEGR